MTQSIPVWIDELPVWLRRALEQRLLPASVGQVTRKLLTELGDQIDPNAVASAVVGAYGTTRAVRHRRMCTFWNAGPGDVSWWTTRSGVRHADYRSSRERPVPAPPDRTIRSAPSTKPSYCLLAQRGSSRPLSENTQSHRNGGADSAEHESPFPSDQFAEHECDPDTGGEPDDVLVLRPAACRPSQSLPLRSAALLRRPPGQLGPANRAARLVTARLSAPKVPGRLRQGR